MTGRKLKIAIPAEEKDVPNYLAALRELGAEPNVVPPDCDVDDFDGLLLPGGIDVDPSFYGKENTACGETSKELDAWQLGVMDQFVRVKKPVFGICRGHQVVNVYFEGTLIQHISCAEQHTGDSVQKKDNVHHSIAEPDSFLAQLYGTDFYTNSWHHQASGQIGKGLKVVQRSDDGIVEGAYHEMLPVWSVQWHPERMCFAHQRSDTVDGSKVLQFFLDRVKEHCR